ncbi:MAG: protein-disulfide reductase DsbD domain-containing protein [Flavobacteriales bacterium]
MRIKAISSVLVFLALATAGFSQIYQPVKWKFSVEMLDDKTAEIRAEATIEAKWHVYALVISDKPDVIGPIPTSIKLDPSKNYTASGKPTEGKFITHFDPNFEIDLNYFENYAVFKQKVKINADKPFKISGQLEYMACNDERCIFPDPEIFELDVTPKGATPAEVVPAEGTVAPTPADQGNGKKSPLSWNYSSSKISDTEFDIIAKTTIESGFHIYSAVSISDGPMPTELINIDPTKFELVGKIQESPIATKHFDENFGTDVYTFEGEATFTQRVKLKDPANTILTAQIKGMYCAEVCTPFFNDFKVDLKTGVGQEYDPLADSKATILGLDPFDWSGDPDLPLNNCGKSTEDITLWAIFLFGIIGGLLALLTPCVFPMIPLTVSFFTKGSEGSKGKKRAITYGIFILLIYFTLSLPFHLSKNVDPEVLNRIATNSWLNIGFFVIFIVFAISFFGFFEITLPSGLANKVDSASNLGGLAGIFFMALTLAIVSFSCTGPILGTVIGSIYSTNAAGFVHFLGMELSLPASKVTAAMTGFGISLGLPFGIFAAFPGLLKKLPKSGGWLQDFKVSLGFLELAFALKFLSNSDLVEQWGILKRESFFAVWILIGTLWALYMLRRFTFKKGYLSSTPVKGFKLVVTLGIILFTLRLIPGLFPSSEWNRFAFMSAFPPPKSWSFYHYEEEFKIYKNLAEGIAAAKAANKPLFVDFTGWACVNCRKMEENMWPREQVKKILANEFVMVSLYVDEKVELPVEEQFIYQTKDGRKKKISNVGDRWATLQTQTFENNSQPMYAIIAPDSTILTPVKQYETDEFEYVNWLQCGVSSYQQWKEQ